MQLPSWVMTLLGAVGAVAALATQNAPAFVPEEARWGLSLLAAFIVAFLGKTNDGRQADRIVRPTD